MVLIHIFFVGITGLVVLFSDEQGFEWMTGKKQILNAPLLDRLHILVSLGLLAIIFTGGLMFIDRASFLLSNPAFLLKMVFIGALIVNGFFVGALSQVASANTFASLSLKEKMPLLISGAVSIVSWGGALLSAFFIS